MIKHCLLFLLSYACVTAQMMTFNVRNTTATDHTVKFEQYDPMTESNYTVGPTVIPRGTVVVVNFDGLDNDEEVRVHQAQSYAIAIGGSNGFTYYGNGSGESYDHIATAEVAGTYNIAVRNTTGWNLPSDANDNFSENGDGGVTHSGDGQLTLKNEVFREGVDKIVSAIGVGAESGGGGGGGGGGDTTQSELLATQQNALFAAYTPMTEVPGVGETAKTAMIGLLSPEPTPTESGITKEVADNFDFLKLTLPAAMVPGMGTIVFDLNPFSSERLGTVLTWFREALEWLILVLLGIHIWKGMGEWIRGFSTIRQAQGNAVAAGSGGQATSLIAAGIITTVIFVASTALVSWSFDGIGFPTFFSRITASPIVNLATNAYTMLNFVYPVITTISALLAKLAFRIYGAAVFAGAMTLIRFITP